MAIQRFRHLIGLLAASLLAMLPAGCTDEPDGPPRVVVIGAQPQLADARAGPLSQSDALLLQSVAQGLVALRPQRQYRRRPRRTLERQQRRA